MNRSGIGFCYFEVIIKEAVIKTVDSFMDIGFSSQASGLPNSPQNFNRSTQTVAHTAQRLSTDSITFSGRKNRLKAQRRLQRQKAATGFSGGFTAVALFGPVFEANR